MRKRCHPILCEPKVLRGKYSQEYEKSFEEDISLSLSFILSITINDSCLQFLALTNALLNFINNVNHPDMLTAD